MEGLPDLNKNQDWDLKSSLSGRFSGVGDQKSPRLARWPSQFSGIGQDESIRVREICEKLGKSSFLTIFNSTFLQKLR